ncbi:MAG: TIGR02281 family clan AA aspartic protease [Gammaproteobacteria bacterium]|nr:TIGR02281 family clan AA aspartic protease [Gammaproteobacteria bacterium]
MDNNPHNYTRRLGKWMIWFCWLLVLGGLTVAFNSTLEKRENPNMNVSSSISATGIREVVLQRNRQGHYVANGKINGKTVTFLVDSGATLVTIPGKLANRLGLKKGRQEIVSTANGNIMVYLTNLEHIQLGEITLQNIKANINPHMDGDGLLLGMSFLKDLEIIQRDKHLTIRQY